MSVNLVVPLPGPRRRATTALLVLWVLGWLLMGAIAGVQLWQLSHLSDTVVESGEALEAVGSGLEALSALPVIGDGPARLGHDVSETAVRVQERGATSRQNVRVLSVVLGLSIALIPTTPVLGLYIPFRRAQAREERAIRGVITEAGADSAFEAFLAHRAVQRLPYDVLSQVTSDPWGDLKAGRYRRLANAELTRLGMAREPRTARGEG